MSKITEELVRKRAEHNEGAIGSLEELSLHMLHIERIEHLDHWCRGLRILLLNNNIISKIENVSRLKQLEYLNLSLNIVEKIENLEGCESLNKLDLTLNFVGELTSVESLKGNYNLKELNLVGNPCSQYEGYRDFVIHALPQLMELDSKEIIRSERIIAAQKMHLGLRSKIIEQQEIYKEKRNKQKLRSITNLDDKLAQMDENLPEEDKLKSIWSEGSEHSPEVRILMSQVTLRQQELQENKPKVQEPKPPRPLRNKHGRPLNINEAQLDFTLTEDEENNSLVLKLHLNKSLDTSKLTSDVHPDHVKVTIHGQIFQLCLLEEVRPDASKAERSLATGCLVITMPWAREHIIRSETEKKKMKKKENPKFMNGPSKREMLEIGRADPDLDFSRIVKYKEDEDNVDNFIDDPEVPPLELADGDEL